MELQGQWEESVWAVAQARLIGAISACWCAQGPDTKSFPSQSSHKALMSSHISFKVIYWAVSNELYVHNTIALAWLRHGGDGWSKQES